MFQDHQDTIGNIEEKVQNYHPDKLAYGNLVAVSPCFILKKIMKEKDISKAELAIMSGLPEKEIEQVCNGEMPTTDACRSLSISLGLSKEYFLNARTDYLLLRRKIFTRKLHL